MKIGYRSSLQRAMIMYFLLIGFASSFIVTEFVLDVHKKELRLELAQNYEKLAEKKIQPDEAFRPMEKIRNKAILMVVILLLVVLILLTMFMKNITEPLQHMIEVSKLIAMGDLSQTVSISARNELAELGNTVNELTSNLQEMILLSKDMCVTAGQFAEEVSNALNSQGMDQGKIESLRRDAQLVDSKTKFLDSIIKNCRFYKIGM